MKAANIAIALVALSTCSAHTDTYTYRCKAKGKFYVLEADDARMKLVWRGNTYNIKVQDSCDKFGWRAVRPGEAFDFCTATQGAADFIENDVDVECYQTKLNGKKIK